MAIAEQANACRQTFHRCLHLTSGSQKEWIENRLVDFNLWAAGLNASATDSSSLDYRLRKLPEICGIIETILQHIQANLGDDSFLQSGSTTPHQLESHEGSVIGKEGHQFYVKASYLPTRYEKRVRTPSEAAIVDDISRLTRLSALIRRMGMQSRFGRADSTFDAAEYTDLSEYLVWRFIAKAVKPGEALRFVREASLTSSQRLDSRQRDVFSASQIRIHKRLIHAVLLRRNRIILANHRSKISNKVSVASTLEPQAENDSKSNPTQSQVLSYGGMSQYSEPSKEIAPTSEGAQRALTATSMGSKVDAALLAPSEPSKSVVTSTGLCLQFPKPKVSRDDALNFQCPICRQNTHVRESRGARWR